MTTPGKFAGLSGKRATLAIVPDAPERLVSPSAGRPSRAGKKALGAHFSPELCRAVNVMAAEEGSSVQALLGEALDLLLRSRGKHIFGER